MQGINWGSLTLRAVISRCFPAVLSRHTQPINRIVSAAVCSSFISALRCSSSLLTFFYPPLLLICPPPLQQQEANEHWEAVFGTSVNLMAAKGGQTPRTSEAFSWSIPKEMKPKRLREALELFTFSRCAHSDICTQHGSQHISAFFGRFF